MKKQYTQFEINSLNLDNNKIILKISNINNKTKKQLSQNNSYSLNIKEDKKESQTIEINDNILNLSQENIKILKDMIKVFQFDNKSHPLINIVSMNEIKKFFNVEIKTYRDDRQFSYQNEIMLSKYNMIHKEDSHRRGYYEFESQILKFSTHDFFQLIQKTIPHIIANSLPPKERNNLNNFDFKVYSPNVTSKENYSMYINDYKKNMIGKPKQNKNKEFNIYDFPSIPFEIKTNNINIIDYKIKFNADYNKLLEPQVLKYYENYDICLIEDKNKIIDNFNNLNNKEVETNISDKQYLKNKIMPFYDSLMDFFKKNDMLESHSDLNNNNLSLEL